MPNPSSMPSPKRSAPPPSLERALLRTGVRARIAASPRCADCGRVPLTGERAYHYEDGRLRCELCRPLRREEPVASERVHGHEHGHAVRIRVRVAA
jgi:hypothetical protein